MVSELPSQAVASVNPGELNFGELPINETIYLPQILTLSNLGDLPLEINALDFESSDFNSGGVENLSIEGLSSEEVLVYFSPTEVGDYESQLIFKSNVGDLTIQLSGKAKTSTGLVTLDQSKIQIYPNPNDGHFTINLENESIQTISIYNSLGEIVLRQKVNSESCETDLSAFSKGLYFINIKTKTAVRVAQIVLH